MRILLGIDDTDNLESRGTGYRARQLANLIEKENLGELKGITRHQLFFDRRIPFTSHNSSACLELTCSDWPGLTTLARDFLLRESADGSDAGLAIASYDQADEEVVSWGLRAKKEILTQKEAITLAGRKNIYLEGLTGTRDGIIGALAAVGLRKYGTDGRYIGVGGREIRELKNIYTVKEIFSEIKIDAITDINGTDIPLNERINVGNWMRPVLINNKITILAHRTDKNENYEWEVTTKDYIKSISG